MPQKVRLLQSGIVNIMADCITNIDDCGLLLVSLSKAGSVEVMQETSRLFSLLSSAPENLEAFDKYVISTVIDLLCCQEEETL